MAPMTQSSEPEQRLTTEPPATSEIAGEFQTKEQEEMQRREQEEVQRREQERICEEAQRKEQQQSSTDVNVNAQIDPKLLQEWQQFDSIISNLESSKEVDTYKVTDTQDTTSKEVPSGTSGLPPTSDIEIIPKYPLDQIILQVEDIPPLDVFYSPKHRAIIKQQRKRRRIDQPSLFPKQTVTANVVWKEEFDPSDDLKKLSQYAGAYSAATMDKASKVSNLLKEKDQEIASLQAQLSEAQQKAQ